jgi:hypothetical protein
MFILLVPGANDEKIFQADSPRGYRGRIKTPPTIDHHQGAPTATCVACRDQGQRRCAATFAPQPFHECAARKSSGWQQSIERIAPTGHALELRLHGRFANLILQQSDEFSGWCHGSLWDKCIYVHYFVKSAVRLYTAVLSQELKTDRFFGEGNRRALEMCRYYAKSTFERD